MQAIESLWDGSAGLGCDDDGLGWRVRSETETHFVLRDLARLLQPCAKTAKTFGHGFAYQSTDLCANDNSQFTIFNHLLVALLHLENAGQHMFVLPVVRSFLRHAF